MKNTKNLKTRVLALVLTALMVVGVIPMAVFAVEPAENSTPTRNYVTPFVTPTGDQVKETLGDDALIYYNNFDSQPSSIGSWGTTVGNVGIGKIQNEGGSLTSVDDGNGGKALQYASGASNFVWNYGTRNQQNTDNSGKSFVFSADFKLGTGITAGDLFNLKSSVATNATDATQFIAVPVWIDASGNLYNGQVKAKTTLTSKVTITEGILAIQNDFSSTSAAFCTADRKIGALSADKFTNVAVAVDVANNVYTIYIDGVAVAENQTFADQAMLDYYKTTDELNGTLDYTNGFGLTAIHSAQRGSNGQQLIYDNWLVYYGTELVNIVGDSLYTGNFFKATTADDVKAALGDALLYYNNFNSQTSAVNIWGRPTGGVGIFKAPPANDNSLVNFAGALNPVNDGNGGKALQYASAQGMSLLWNYNDGLANIQHSETSGKSFTFSIDLKLGTKTCAGNLIILRSTVGGTCFTARPVWIDGDGNLYNGQIKQEQELIGEISQIAITEGILAVGATAEENEGPGDIPHDSTAFNTEDRKIGALSADKFTNVAVSVDVEKNVYTIYIDGVAVAENQTFACQNMLDYYEEKDKEDGKTDYTNGFGMTAISIGWRDTLSKYDTNILIDNWLVYYGNKLLRTDVSGYVAENGGIYYYEDGKLVVNSVSKDGIFTIDANGKVFYGETAVTSMADYYKYVGNEIVPVDGIYSGFYKGNIIFGATDGNTYYYDTAKKLVTDKAVYDIKDHDATVTDEAVAYAINKNGVATLYTGVATLSGGKRVYENGVRKTGLITFNGKYYYADENEYLITGEKEIGGKMWDFDSTTCEGAIRDGLWIVNEGTADEYANLYIEGVLQTEDSAESFATANPFTYKGKSYYIEPDASIEGQTKLYKADGLVNINNILYTFVKYICAKTQETVFDGKYYDIAGNIVKETLFEGKNMAGETVWYHADNETGELIILSANIATLIGDKWYVSAETENEPYIIKPANSVLITENGEYRLYEEGVIFTGSFKELDGYTVIVKNSDGDLYTANANDPKEFIKGNYWYVAPDATAPYALTRAEGVYKSVFAGEEESYRFFQNGELFTDGIYEIEPGVWYAAKENGDLYVIASTNDPILIADKWIVNAGGAEYTGAFANGVYYSDYDRDNLKTYRYFINGDMQTASTVVGQYTYIILENGDLVTTEYTDRPDYFDGMWYVKGGENDYELVYANGMLVTSDKAPEGEANERKLFEDGFVNYGDANREFLDGGVLVNKYDPDGSLYYDYNGGVLAADGKTYDFDGYVAVVRDNYMESADGFVWVDGYKVTDGIHMVPVIGGDPVQMHFKGGKAAAGEVVQTDGSVLAFGDDGKRIVFEGDNEPVAKYPHSIIIITQLKDGDTVTRLSKRDLYRFWNTSYTYVPYYSCYGYTITIDGVEVTAAEGEVLKAYIEATDENDHVIVVTFDTSIDYHTHYELVEDECVAATCVSGGIDVYVCSTCGRNARKTVNTEVDPSNHKLSTEETAATHTTMGIITTICDNGCGYREYEYLPMIAHTWTEVAGSRVEPECGTSGSVQYSCECDVTRTDTLAATGAHNYVVSAKVDPSCSVDGAVYYVCSGCGASYSVKTPATGVHTHGANDSYTVLNDVIAGLETRVYNCNSCGAIGVIYETVSVDEDDE